MPLVVDATAGEVAASEREPDIAVSVVGNVAEDDVKEWCAKNLSAYKQPASVRLEPLLDATRSSSE
jgi:hypothetical protein